MSVLLDLTPLRASPAFRRLWWGLGISNFGTQLTVVAVGLQVYDLTRSTLAVGVLGICALVPLVGLGLYGGALVDAHDRRRVALLSSFGLWLVVLALAAQAWLGVGSVELLYALVALQSAGFAINNPARSAIVPRLIDPQLLPAANVLQTIAWNVALTVGPLVGAFLVASWDFSEAYTIDAVLFTVALWALWRLPELPPLHESADNPEAAAPKRGLSSVLEGLRYLATRPNVRMTFVVDLIAMILSMPRVLFPAVGVLFLGGGATTTGILSAAFAAGAVLAGLFSGGLVGIRWQGRVIAVAICCFGLSVVGFGVVLVLVGPTSPDRVLVGALIVALAFLALAGASDAVSSVFRQTILQSATPDDMRGRLQGIFIVVVAGGPRLGDLVLGAEASLLHEGWAAVIGGACCAVLVVAVTVWQRRFLAYDGRHPVP
ncbi:MFS transporter [Microlunatus panaciterrae]|uniref:MFS family permease n=1 Tax=Microlunatus panaciterrae TaxID=400768 RepID=A0ABS2RJH9_9ACTN|nr:MFS transporter [Microlunatus panaciterrae]MBM7799168.1 MFS family permease [Microlunatus panaciterrae]